MAAAGEDCRVQEPASEGSGAPRGLHAFARMTASGILCTVLNPTCGGRLAEELSSAVVAAALGEASVSRTPGMPSDAEPLLEGTAEEGDGEEHASLRASGAFQPPLSQSGLPVVGSLDYPDAPPTTPLLPELVRSRDGFSRKLKGGLAKEFLPSPPPPTPKDERSEAGLCRDPGAALMEHVMRSLSTGSAGAEEPAPGGDLPADARGGGAKMAAYAGELSRQIVDWAASRYASGTAVRERIGEQDGEDGDLHRLAGQLAQVIVTSSMKELR